MGERTGRPRFGGGLSFGKPKYEIRAGQAWIRCKKAQLQPSKWLHYELHDGTNGIAKPGSWREAK
jgi:hypothetical protein